MSDFEGRTYFQVLKRLIFLKDDFDGASEILVLENLTKPDK